MSVGVVIVAGGRGVRLGGEVPKQLLDLGGRSILQRSLAAFDAHPGVDELVVVLPGDLVGRGTVDMKGGVAVQLKAAVVPEPSRDLTFVFYEGEEIDSAFNGLLHVQQQRPDLIDDADFAVLLEPTAAQVEGGCKGTLRVDVTTRGVAAHSARPAGGHPEGHPAALPSLPSRTVSSGHRRDTVEATKRRDAMNRNTKAQIAGLAGGATAIGAALYVYKHRGTPRKGISLRKAHKIGVELGIDWARSSTSASGRLA